MGCDIHLVLEERDPDLGWVGVNTFAGTNGNDYHSPIARDRNYRLFAALAGVRGEGPEPRGIPDSASSTTRLLVKQWGGDGHSHSWLPLAEAVPLFNKRWYEEGETAKDPKPYRDGYPSSYWFGVESDNIENYRLVFWFDN